MSWILLLVPIKSPLDSSTFLTLHVQKPLVMTLKPPIRIPTPPNPLPISQPQEAQISQKKTVPMEVLQNATRKLEDNTPSYDLIPLGQLGCYGRNDLSHGKLNDLPRNLPRLLSLSWLVYPRQVVRVSDIWTGIKIGAERQVMI